MNQQFETHFSTDYATARGRFRSAALAAGAALDALMLDVRGPGGEELSIDIACIGAQKAQRVLLHTCGVHGVEAFAGSAVQLAALAEPPVTPAACALVLVHVLNPYGMAWLRRANENNVDLNRNFLDPGDRRESTSPLYFRLDHLLNPPTAAGPDGYPLRLAATALRHGIAALKQAIAEGQYEFPRGLFYGGTALEAGPRLYLDWLRRNQSGAGYLFALDFHTGLGRHGEESLILEPGAGATPLAELERALGRRLADPAAGQTSYRIRGGMGGALPEALNGRRVDFLLQEIGTRSPLAVLRALREENRWHQHGAGGLAHRSKQALCEALNPAAVNWRRRAVSHGLSLLHRAAAWTFGKH